MTHRVRVPLLSVNEDDAVVTRVYVAVGDHVRLGERLLEVETTKTSADIEAPSDGYVRELGASSGDRRRVGEIVVVLTTTADEPVEVESEDLAPSRPTASTITPRARSLAEHHGIDWRAIPARGIVTERDVRALIPTDAEEIPPAGRRLAHDAVLPLVILGAGGGGKVLAELVRHLDWLEVEGFLDPGVPPGAIVADYPVLGDDSQLSRLVEQRPHAGAIACGLIHFDPRIRIRAYETCRSLDVALPPLVHPTAFVDPSARLGDAVQVHAMAVVGADALLEDGVVVNSSAVVSHDVRVGRHSHITPGALIAGSVTIGERCIIGMGATVLNGVAIGDDVIVNNGCAVLRDLESGVHLR